MQLKMGFVWGRRRSIFCGQFLCLLLSFFVDKLEKIEFYKVATEMRSANISKTIVFYGYVSSYILVFVFVGFK